MVQLPRLRAGRPANNNFAGIGACDSCGNGFQFCERAERCARASSSCSATTPTPSRACHAHPDPPVPELWGSTPATAESQLRPLLRQGTRAALEQHGQRQLGDLARLHDRRAARLQPDAHFSGQPGQCPPDGLLFGPLTAAGPCPVEPAPAGPRHRGDAERRLLRAERQRHRQRVQRRARARSRRPSDVRPRPRHRGDARRHGLRRAHQHRHRLQVRLRHRSCDRRHARHRLLRRGDDRPRSIAIMPDGKGYADPARDGSVC